MAKLGVASANVKEIIGKGLLDALAQMGDSNSVQDTADAMETLAQNTADVIRGIGILAGKLKSIPLVNAIVRTLGDSFSAGPLGSLMRLGQSNVKTGYGQQSPGERAAAVAYQKKLAAQKREEYLALVAKNKATKEEAQMKKDQEALDKLKAKFDLERIGLNAALNQATDEETKARIRAQIAILDETGKSAQAANDALVKAQAEKLDQEVKAATALAYLSYTAGLAANQLNNINGRVPGVTFNPTQQPDRNYVPSIPSTNIPPRMPDGTPTLIPGTDYNPAQQPDRNVDQKAGISVVVNTGPSMADENVIVDAVQAALNEIARRGYLTTYAGALPA
jgi:hypothetical protein